MVPSAASQVTDFTRDVLGRYVCNGLDEALRAAGRNGERPAGRPQHDARPFDIIVVGGGTFGSAVAAHLFSVDKAHRRRVLVLEGGPFVLTEHVQALPMVGLDVPAPTSIADLRRAGQDRVARNEVWGLAWHSSTTCPGLAYCVGGRSLYWGGWSPRLLDSEMPIDGTSPNPWPQTVVADLNARYFDEATEQIGVDETNDFIYGPLQNALRQQLFDGINGKQVTDAVPLAELPPHPAVRTRATAPTRQEFLDLLGLSTAPATLSAQHLQKLLNLEAPLPGQPPTLPAFFPFSHV